jgi:hypothetical protein
MVCIGLGLALVIHAAEEAPPVPRAAEGQKEFEAITQQYENARGEFFRAYEAAKTDEDRARLSYPEPQAYAGRFLALAKKYPKDPAAVDALVWIVTNVNPGPDYDRALGLLTTDYLTSDKLGPVCETLVYRQTQDSEKLLRTLCEKGGSRSVQGQATFCLGRFLLDKSQLAARAKKQDSKATDAERFYGEEYATHLRQSDPAALTAEAEKLLNEVVEKFGDLKPNDRTLAESAQAELFELHYLAIGKVAPDIEGEDVDGRNFKLSEYRGKVVVIDFWGDW